MFVVVPGFACDYFVAVAVFEVVAVVFEQCSVGEVSESGFAGDSAGWVGGLRTSWR